MSVSKEEVKYIAKLSKLELTVDEIDKYAKKLSDIVEFANQLSVVDISNVEPTAQILDIYNVFKDDEIYPSMDRDAILKNAPSKAAGCISVPKVMEEI
ncbi:MAG: Asp-tRNA(Asn)/Glu-tRNA(Gln) amidotransferase subunit GatC [Clostridia bacterium]